MAATQREEKLRNLQPKVEWVKCQGANHNSVNIESHRGTMRIPSSYDNPVGRSFNLGVQRFTVTGKQPIAHYIMLSGGPGGYGSSQIPKAERLLALSDGKMAIYTVDHRGLGASGEILGAGVNLFDLIESGRLEEKLKNTPFDLKDLTLKNASLDVSMLGLAIQTDPLFGKGNRLVLWGFSYGAQWVNHTIQLTPMIYDAAVIGGVPKIKGTPSPTSLIGLAENCAQDNFCRSKMGGNVLDTLERAARSIVEPNFNSCTQLFHDQFPMIGHTGERVMTLGGMLGPLILGNSKQLGEWRDFRTSQLVLPFIKATYDCVDANLYRDTVLRPIAPFISRVLKIQNGSTPVINSLVNNVVLFDTKYEDFKTGPLEFQHDYKSMHPYDFVDVFYEYRWQSFEPFLKGRQLSKERPLISPKTEVYVAASRMDSITPYIHAWEYFEAIKVPKKHWMLFENRPHDGHESDCLYEAIMVAASGSTVEFDWEGCIRKNNQLWKVDWNFSEQPVWKNMWNAVSNASNKQLVLKNVPIHQTKIFTGEIVVPPEPSEVISKTTMLVAAGVGIFALIAVVVIVWWIWKMKKARSESPESPCS